MFVIPVLVMEEHPDNPIGVVKQSAGVIRKTWGEALAGYAGLQVGGIIVGFGSIFVMVVAIAWRDLPQQHGPDVRRARGLVRLHLRVLVRDGRREPDLPVRAVPLRDFRKRARGLYAGDADDGVAAEEGLNGRRLVGLQPPGLQLRAELLPLRAVAVAVAEIGEVVVAQVRARAARGVLDRAEVLLGARGDFARVGDQAVGVAAVVAVDPLDPIEILRDDRGRATT